MGNENGLINFTFFYFYNIICLINNKNGQEHVLHLGMLVSDTSLP